MKISFLIILIISFNSCQNQTSIPEKVADYLNEVIDLLEKNSINKNAIDWNAFRKDVFKKSQHAKSIEDTYPVITYAVTKLNDHHSYFKSNFESHSNSDDKPLPELTDEKTPDDIGYIRVPFCIGTENEYEKYISAIRSKIRTQSMKNLKGWIIDLRRNFGGNMWPMLLSIEPLIGNGILGYFADADNNFHSWKLNKGKAFIDDELILETAFFAEPELSNAFVAILTDENTASSGEAVAVALKGRPHSKSFGKQTFGVSTGCVSHQLSDGSTINLAETVFADRKMNKYGFKINPDEAVEENQTLQSGIEWIYKMYRNNN